MRAVLGRAVKQAELAIKTAHDPGRRTEMYAIRDPSKYRGVDGKVDGKLRNCTALQPS